MSKKNGKERYKNASTKGEKKEKKEGDEARENGIRGGNGKVQDLEEVSRVMHFVAIPKSGFVILYRSIGRGLC